MKRRTFLNLCGLAGGAGVMAPLFTACTNKGQRIRFGLITDLHFARRERNGERYYVDSLNKLREAIAEFNRQPLDFIIELGDLKDQGIKPEAAETLSFLDEIEKELHTFKGDVYHVLGNHDMDSLTKEEFLSHTHNPSEADGKAVYSFKKKGYKFIVMDANFNADRSDYRRGNFNWEVALVPEPELQWLEKELKKGDEPVILFIHQLLDAGSGVYKGLYVRNAAEVNRLLVDSKRVAAVFQGHHHAGFYSQMEGIHYFTMPGMIVGPYPKNNSFAIVEITPEGDLLVDGFSRCRDKIMRV